METKTKQENVDKPGTSSRRVERLVRHLLKYGGCWIVVIIVYVTLMWAIPWKLGGTPWGVPIAHGAVGFFAWILYGMGAFDGDP